MAHGIAANDRIAEINFDTQELERSGRAPSLHASTVIATGGFRRYRAVKCDEAAGIRFQSAERLTELSANKSITPKLVRLL